MLKNVQKLHKTINDRLIELTVDNDTPIGDVKDVLFEFLKYVYQIEAINSIQQAQAQHKKEEVNDGVEPSV